MTSDGTVTMYLAGVGVDLVPTLSRIFVNAGVVSDDPVYTTRK